MMPRHFTEEIVGPRGWGAGHRAGFNDASAFHRGNQRQFHRVPSGTSCFNDASAFHRGNPARWSSSTMTRLSASMMPRHFTEEIAAQAQPKRRPYNGFNDASAFHRGNHQRVGVRLCAADASMMPRHFTEEIQDPCGRHAQVCRGFNDASAFHRGNRQRSAQVEARLAEASMMPRHFTEEIVLISPTTPSTIPMLQ